MSVPAKVYFTDFHVKLGESPLDKLARLLKAAGLNELPLRDQFTAVKIHFGEAGNVAYIRPNYAHVLVQALKDAGARPFLTDCNTLYTGSRRNALEHLECAAINGFTPTQVGCQILIADGLLGTDDVAVPIPGEYCKEAHIGRGIMDADVIISLNHFKGHEGTGFGGALKNLGMGCGSTAGKRQMHHEGKPQVDPKSCVGCGKCAKSCAFNAISFVNRETGKGRYAVVDQSACTGCHRCVGICTDHSAITGPDSSCEMLCKKIAEYALAVTQNRPQFHISLITDVSPHCDCYGGNDTPIIAPVGMFASVDPVALDTACLDAANHAMRLHGTAMDTKPDTGDLFHDLYDYVDGRSALVHGEKIGLGTMNYELITVQ